jgi:hypothetical protein
MKELFIVPQAFVKYYNFVDFMAWGWTIFLYNSSALIRFRRLCVFLVNKLAIRPFWTKIIISVAERDEKLKSLDTFQYCF